MRRSSPFRLGGAFAALLLTALLAAPAGAAPSPAAPRAAFFLVSPVFDLLLGSWLRVGGWGTAPGPPHKEGPCADPDGRCAGATPHFEAGCIGDPDGHCLGATTSSEAGCIGDPNGRCGG